MVSATRGSNAHSSGPVGSCTPCAMSGYPIRQCPGGGGPTGFTASRLDSRGCRVASMLIGYVVLDTMVTISFMAWCCLPSTLGRGGPVRDRRAGGCDRTRGGTVGVVRGQRCRARGTGRGDGGDLGGGDHVPPDRRDRRPAARGAPRLMRLSRRLCRVLPGRAGFG